MVIDRCLFECLSKVVNKETSVFPFFYNFFFLLFFLLCDLHSLSNSSVVSLRFLDFSETSFPGIRSSIHFFHRFFSPFFHKMHLFEKDFYYFAFTFCWSCSVFSLKLVQFVEFSLLFCKSYLLAEAP